MDTTALVYPFSPFSADCRANNIKGISLRAPLIGRFFYGTSNNQSVGKCVF